LKFANAAKAAHVCRIG